MHELLYAAYPVRSKVARPVQELVDKFAKFRLIKREGKVVD